MTRDPTSYLGGVNLYNYVANNPINFIDPLGLDKLPLPKHPSGLPPGWKPDPTHKNPNGERWRGPGGDTIDFHKGQPGRRGWAGEDHWHHNDGKKHYRPGDEIEVEPSCGSPGTDPQRARQRLPGPGMDELRMEELSHRQMEIFWGKILGGSIIGGGVVVGGPAVVGPLLKLLQRTPVLAIP